MLEPNAVKVTMLFPMYANDGTPFPAEVWDWWLVNIVAIGAYHEFFTRGAWEGQFDYHRCVTMILETDDQLRRVRSFLEDARVKFEQQRMYFEAENVRFELI